MKKSNKKYIKQKITAGNTVEVINYISGRIGAQGNNREKREKVTPEKIRRWQDKRAEDHCRWQLNTNFKPGDLWLRFGYPANTRKTAEEIKANITLFLKKLRKIYKKAGKVLKYIFSVGKGKRGGIHFHMVLNRIETVPVVAAWQEIAGTESCRFPSVDIKHLDRAGYYPKVAAYIIKNGLETFRSSEKIYNKRYCASRSLDKPKIKREIITAGKWLEKPRAIKGYYLDRDSVWEGTADSGFPYQSYTLVRLQI